MRAREIWTEPVDWDVSCFEIGWFIDKGLEGRGYAYEASLAGMGFIFDELEARATMDDTNVRSYLLAERLGFVRAQRVGELLYGILRSEHNI